MRFCGDEVSGPEESKEEMPFLPDVTSTKIHSLPTQGVDSFIANVSGVKKTLNFSSRYLHVRRLCSLASPVRSLGEQGLEGLRWSLQVEDKCGGTRR